MNLYTLPTHKLYYLLIWMEDKTFYPLEKIFNRILETYILLYSVKNFPRSTSKATLKYGTVSQSGVALNSNKIASFSSPTTFSSRPSHKKIIPNNPSSASWKNFSSKIAWKWKTTSISPFPPSNSTPQLSPNLLNSKSKPLKSFLITSLSKFAKSSAKITKIYS